MIRLPSSSRPRTPKIPPLSFLALALVAIGSIGCSPLGLGDEKSKEPSAEDTTLLFIGSSYTAFNNIPDRVRDLSRKAGHKVFVGYYLALGQPLSYFAQDPATSEVIRSRDWDFVILQGGSRSAAYPREGGDSDYLALRELHRKATEDSPGTRVVYMMPWAYEDGMSWLEGRDETYEDMQLEIKKVTVGWAHDLDLVLAPVGMAWYEVLTSWSHDIHFLHDEDWNHASKEGSFLTAATIFSTIWVEDAGEVTYDWEIEKGLAQDLREVAGATVLDSLALWNIVR